MFNVGNGEWSGIQILLLSLMIIVVFDFWSWPILGSRPDNRGRAKLSRDKVNISRRPFGTAITIFRLRAFLFCLGSLPAWSLASCCKEETTSNKILQGLSSFIRSNTSF